MKIRRLVLFIGGVTCMVIASIGLSQSTRALTGTISWTSADDPTINISEAGVQSWVGNCTPQKVYISNSLPTQGDNKADFCAVSRNGWRYGHYTHTPPGWPFSRTETGYAISFSNDSKIYKLQNVPDFQSPFNTPGTNDLVYWGYNYYHASLHIIKNITSKLTRTVSGLQVEYVYNGDEPDLTLKRPSGDIVKVERVGSSSNGKWLAVQATDIGLLRINTETFEVKRFSDTVYRYGYGLDPAMELAITNDGRHVAVAGLNVAPYMYDIDDDCGDAITDSMDDSTPIANPCSSKHIAPLYASYMPRFDHAAALSFSDDGSSLTSLGVVYDYDQGYNKWFTLTAPGYDSPTLDYLALGDSYSSGEGDLGRDSNNRKYYRAGTNIDGSRSAPEEKCHVSTRSYPYLLATTMGLGEPLAQPNTNWQTVACSGATTWDVKEQGSEDYKGQNDRLDGYNSDSLKIQALNEFIPGRQKQIEFVKKYRPKVITLTMGGNDVGFGDKIAKCVLSILGTCDYAKDQLDSPSRYSLGEEIKNMYSNLRSLYLELYEASGYQAKIYVLGYPQFINGDTDASCGINVGVLNKQERIMIQNGTTYLNDVIEQAAKSVGVKYVNIEDSLNGHRLCEDGDKYVNGITSIVNKSIITGNYRQESFHPNTEGNAAIAASIRSNLNSRNLLDYDVCPNSSENICPDTLATEDNIPTPTYFQSNNSPTNTHYQYMTSKTGKQNDLLRVTFLPYSFDPNSQIEALLYSEPTNLGEYQVGVDGSLSADIQIPSNIEPGYHTLMISGTTYSGELIEYEQVVLIESLNPDDIDGDGVDDANDSCLFIPPSYQDIDMDGVDDACDPDLSSSNNQVENSYSQKKIEQGTVNYQDQNVNIENRNTVASLSTLAGTPQTQTWSTTQKILPENLLIPYLFDGRSVQDGAASKQKNVIILSIVSAIILGIMMGLRVIIKKGK